MSLLRRSEMTTRKANTKPLFFVFWKELHPVLRDECHLNSFECLERRPRAIHLETCKSSDADFCGLSEIFPAYSEKLSRRH